MVNMEIDYPTQLMNFSSPNSNVKTLQLYFYDDHALSSYTMDNK